MGSVMTSWIVGSARSDALVRTPKPRP